MAYLHGGHVAFAVVDDTLHILARAPLPPLAAPDTLQLLGLLQPQIDLSLNHFAFFAHAESGVGLSGNVAMSVITSAILNQLERSIGLTYSRLFCFSFLILFKFRQLAPHNVVRVGPLFLRFLTHTIAFVDFPFFILLSCFECLTPSPHTDPSPPSSRWLLLLMLICVSVCALFLIIFVRSLVK